MHGKSARLNTKGLTGAGYGVLAVSSVLPLDCIFHDECVMLLSWQPKSSFYPAPAQDSMGPVEMAGWGEVSGG